MEKMLDPLTIRFSQGNIGESFKDLVWVCHVTVVSSTKDLST